jgi:hypothetical protein
MPLDSFSAHCFHTFQELSHILDGQNKSTPLGLVEVAWYACHFIALRCIT